ncbi:Dam1p NDAI_0G01060 [Naumovozyma dairenensis CBS 421]|uniref:DASH complex subunit DAM1 n=1 Tax=Naumovozyma dairenensis (strain ATCC 10597 / BCRC 20456 / CBS 421 / NBRC 0211 / NRRL Y-12639) TaxID=1071378 RepID=G0WDM1_NAUDC|nr:hypothetical protein NDAI_0G01060 [Naumovozyma dairenensis CBS 421]CCD25882.2 hypothetical protein NDAI_0G01060 [Naumovozyma dairenensis CBS 421]
MNQEQSEHGNNTNINELGTTTALPTTDYKLSISSNPGSRRSSMNDGDFSSSNNLHQQHLKYSDDLHRTPGSDAADAFHSNTDNNGDDGNVLLQTYLLPQIQELTESMVTLDTNFTRLNFIHESLVDLNESVGSLLYGLMCNSWCVEFPNVPHDLEKELKIMKRLENLKDEKKRLQRQLAAVKDHRAAAQKPRPNSSSSSSNNSNLPQQRGKFAQPLFPSTQGTKRTASIHAEHLHKNLREDEQEQDIDDNSSEASFVSNPAIDTQRIRSQTAGTNRLGANNRNAENSKLRRHSILHTIRNSVASNADMYGSRNERTTATQDNGGARRSLGHRATRVVVKGNNVQASSTAQRRGTILQGYAARISKPMSKRPSMGTNALNNTRTHENPDKNSSNSNSYRPPFR